MGDGRGFEPKCGQDHPSENGPADVGGSTEQHFKSKADRDVHLVVVGLQSRLFHGGVQSQRPLLKPDSAAVTVVQSAPAALCNKRPFGGRMSTIPRDVVPAPAAIKSSPRLLSLDALRGFDMLWILGGDVLIKALTDQPSRIWLPRPECARRLCP